MAEKCKKNVFYGTSSYPNFCQNERPCPIPGHDATKYKCEHSQRADEYAPCPHGCNDPRCRYPVVTQFNCFGDKDHETRECGKPLVDGKCADHPSAQEPAPLTKALPPGHADHPHHVCYDLLRDLAAREDELRAARAKIAELQGRETVSQAIIAEANDEIAKLDRIIEAVRALQVHYINGSAIRVVYKSDLDAIVGVAPEATT